MKILVCGGHHYGDYKTVDQVLRRYINPFDGESIVITGGAAGADSMTEQWCEKNGIHNARVVALWKAHGKAAGPIRNRAMLELSPELVIAFPGGWDTADMCQQAALQHVEVMRVTSSQSEE